VTLTFDFRSRSPLEGREAGLPFQAPQDFKTKHSLLRLQLQSRADASSHEPRS